MASDWFSLPMIKINLEENNPNVELEKAKISQGFSTFISKQLLKLNNSVHS